MITLTKTDLLWKIDWPDYLNSRFKGNLFVILTTFADVRIHILSVKVHGSKIFIPFHLQFKIQ